MGDSVLPPEFLDVLRLSLKGTESLVDAAAKGPSDTTNPRIRKLIQEILFSRRFILTYYIVLGALLIGYAALHWTRKTLGGRRHRVVKEPYLPADSGASSSSSSTLQGIESPPLEDGNKFKSTERTPLIAVQETLQETRRSTASTLVDRLRAFLKYQPRPIPAITSPVNVLPPNGTTMVILTFLALNLFYLFYHVPLSLPMLFILADRAGLCFVVNLPILYVLGAKNNQPLKMMTGWSYEGLNIFHRRLGEWMIALGTLHGGAMIAAFFISQPLGRPTTLLQFLMIRLILLGILALISYLAIYITSIGWFRQLYYEVFLGLHVILQVAALAFLFFHYHTTRPYVIASVAIWALDRLVTRMMVSNKKFVATLEVAEDGDTVLLFCDVPISRPQFLPGSNMSHGWQAGQHVFVTVPGIGATHRVQAHPFTIASPAPPATLCRGTWLLQLTIRAHDGFSKDLLEYAKFHQHAEIWLDGPYGSTEIVEAVRNADRTCLIAGGSGIAVTYPLAWDIHVQDGEDVWVGTRVLYKDGVKQLPFVATVTMPSDQGKCAHLWARQDPRHQRWVTMLPRLTAIKSRTSLDRAGTDEADADHTTVDLITSTFETRNANGGRPDLETELREWVTFSSSPGKTVNGKQEKICVVVSGPDGLVRDVRNGAASLVRAGYNIDVHVEKFGW